MIHDDVHSYSRSQDGSLKSFQALGKSVVTGVYKCVQFSDNKKAETAAANQDIPVVTEAADLYDGIKYLLYG